MYLYSELDFIMFVVNICIQLFYTVYIYIYIFSIYIYD